MSSASSVVDLSLFATHPTMNIGYLVSFPWYPPRGAGTVHAYQVAHQLTKRGHSLHAIWCDERAPNLTLYRRRSLFKFLHNTEVLYIRIHGRFNFENLTLLKALKFFSLPVVWEINAPLEELLARGSTPREIRRLNLQRAIMAKFVDAAICVSKELLAYATQDLGIKHSYLVPNGSDKDLFSPAKRDQRIFENQGDHFKVIWCGSSQYRWQGIDTILEVARRIHLLNEKIVFVLVTKAANLQQYQPVPPNVAVIDQQSYFDLPPYLASADAGLCLYHDVNHHRGFHMSPLKLFDYMASGLPVIATGLGQISDVIEHGRNGVLVSDDPDDIVNNILFLRGDPEERTRMGAEARKDVDNYYNWERVGAETERVLEAAQRT